jgi:hypothetical protein
VLSYRLLELKIIDIAKATRGKDDYGKSMVNYFKRRPLGHDMGGSGRSLDWTTAATYDSEPCGSRP